MKKCTTKCIGRVRVEITNTNQYYLYWDAFAKSGGSLGGGPEVMGGTVSTEWSDGGWYDYIIEVDYSQGQNGTARVWMAKDGQTPVLRATSSGSLSGGAALPGITWVALGLNFNQTRAANQNQALWYGQWEVIDGVQHPLHTGTPNDLADCYPRDRRVSDTHIRKVEDTTSVQVLRC